MNLVRLFVNYMAILFSPIMVLPYFVFLMLRAIYENDLNERVYINGKDWFWE